jgi:methylmalonyl-CoA carboxyltransferase large subunit
MADEGTVGRSEFEALVREIAELRAQIAGLSASAKKPPEPKVSDELITVIVAAVAAYLGKKATVRFIRKANSDESNAWQGYGRASISGSHALPKLRGW